MRDGSRSKALTIRKLNDETIELKCIDFQSRTSEGSTIDNRMVFSREVKLMHSAVLSPFETEDSNYQVDFIGKNSDLVELSLCPVHQKMDYRRSLIHLSFSHDLSNNLE